MTPGLAVTHTAAAPVIADVTPTLGVPCATPVPVIEHVAPAPMMEYIVPAPPVTFSSPSQQLPPAYAMDITGLVMLGCSTETVLKSS